MRALVQVARCAELLDAARVEDRDAVRESQRLFLIVRHEDECDAELTLDLLELDLHLLAQLEVEGAERLVEQQHLGLHDGRPGERDALTLPPESWAGRRSAYCSSRTEARAFIARSRRCARLIPRTRSPYATLSSTLMCGKSA